MAYGHLDIWTFGHWTFGHMDIWTYGQLDIWTMDIWTFATLKRQQFSLFVRGFFCRVVARRSGPGNSLFHHHKAPNFFNPPPTKLTLQHSKAKIAHQIEEQRIFLPQICGKIGSSRT